MFGPIKPNVNLIRHTGSLFIIKNGYISFTGMAFSFSQVFFLHRPPTRICLLCVGELSVCVRAFRRRRWVWCNLYVVRVVLRCWRILLHWFGYITLHSYTGAVSRLCVGDEASDFPMRTLCIYVWCVFAYLTSRGKLNMCFSEWKTSWKGGSNTTRSVSVLGEMCYYVGHTL